MTNTWKAILIVGYLALAGTFFLFYLFPADGVKAYLLSGIHRVDNRIAVDIDRIVPAFPPGLRLESLRISWAGKPLLDDGQMLIRPKWTTIFGSNRRLLTRAKTGTGSIEGQIDLYGGSDIRQIDIFQQLTDIRIRNNKALETMLGRKLEAVLNGKISFRHEKQPENDSVKAELTLTDCHVGTALPLLDIKELDFTRIESTVSVSAQTMTIKRCIFEGKQIDGRLAGTIFVRRPLDKSRLDLKGRIKPQAAFWSRLKKQLPNIGLFPANVGSGIPVHIGGTIEQPRLSFNG